MAILLTILFFAALVGVFRPYQFIQGGRRWHYGLAAFGILILMGIMAPDRPEDAETSPQSSPSGSAAASGAASPSAQPTEAPDPPKWTYSETKDEMRGAVRRLAELESENSVDLDFPYDEQSAFLTVRQDPQYGFDVIFHVRSGQILCHGFGDSYINAKFDDGPIRRFNCNGASDGTSDVAFVEGARTFLAALKTADRTVIEAEFYQNGRVQYVFDTKGLEWE